MLEPNALLTVKETASFLKLNPLTVYEYIRRGQLRAVKFGRYYRIRAENLQTFIELHTVGGNHE